jgi:hypothetical protein
MLRGLSIHSAPLALAGALWPPFCDLPPWPGGGPGGETGGTSGQAGASSGGGGAETGGSGASSGAAGSAGAGGEEPEPGDPVLGCSAAEWPSQAQLVPLPPVEFDDLAGQSDLRKLSANGEVVIADYVVDVDLYNEPDGHRPIFWKGGDWQWVDADTSGISTAVNCDGSVIAGRRSHLDGFIKTANTPLVVLPGEEPWAAIPADISADGTRIGGNLTTVQEGPGSGQTRPVLWTSAGDSTLFEPPAPRTLRHLRYDGSLLAGHRNICAGQKFCDALAWLFVSPIPFEETLYPDMPWSVMSSDLSTSTGASLPPGFHWGDGMHEVAIFRIPDQFTEFPCPTPDECEAVAISSRGNIVLVNRLYGENPPTAYVWTADRGFQDIVALLAADGVPFRELTFTAVDMSDDGRVLLGSGGITHEDGEVEYRAFRVLLPRRVYESP